MGLPCILIPCGPIYRQVPGADGGVPVVLAGGVSCRACGIGVVLSIFTRGIYRQVPGPDGGVPLHQRRGAHLLLPHRARAGYGLRAPALARRARAGDDDQDDCLPGIQLSVYFHSISLLAVAPVFYMHTHEKIYSHGEREQEMMN